VIHHKWIAAGVVGAALLAGCSSSTSGSADQSGSDHHSGSPGSLSGALALVAADDNTRAWLEYGRPKAIVAANGGSSATGTYGGVSGYGFSDLANYAKLLPPLVGFDATTADEALTAGQPPTHAGWISGGVDATKVEQALTKVGAKKDGATLRLAGDNELNLEGPLSKALQAPMPMLNVVSTSGSSLRYGSGGAAVDLVGEPKGATLDADATVNAVAACLGDPLVAVVTDQPAGPSGPRRELGLAVTGTSSGDATEELCIATGSAADAAAMKIKLQDGLTSGTSQRSNEPWSQLLTGVSVEIRNGNVVRATAHPVAGQPAGTLLQALRNKDLASLIG
jgi:hypothetical protein